MINVINVFVVGACHLLEKPIPFKVDKVAKEASGMAEIRNNTLFRNQ
jgi:hypothetical protein